MKILVFALLSFFIAPGLAAQGVRVGEIYQGDLTELVSNESFETVTNTTNLDIDLDGIEEVALGVTCGNGGCDYYIFKPTNDDTYTFLGKLFFHSKAISVDPQTGIIKTYIRLSATEGCDIYYSHDDKGYSKLKRECNQ